MKFLLPVGEGPVVKRIRFDVGDWASDATWGRTVYSSLVPLVKDLRSRW